MNCIVTCIMVLVVAHDFVHSDSVIQRIEAERRVAEPTCSLSVFGLDKELMKGTSMQPEGRCLMYECKKPPAPNVVRCFEGGISSGCYVTQADPSKPFPSCCPTVACPDG